MNAKLSKEDILKLLGELNDELAVQAITGELYLVGGAVMCLVFNARPATHDIDAYFAPTSEIRRAALKIASRHSLPEKWLNDAVKGFMETSQGFDPYLELSNLKVFTAQPEYLLAMKCLSLRLGAEFFDEEDARFLLRYLNITTYEEALEIICRYYPLEKFPQKTFYALEEILKTK